jgi:peptidoglycan/LPS O-acetylase OafA/YrhL
MLYSATVNSDHETDKLFSKQSCLRFVNVFHSIMTFSNRLSYITGLDGIRAVAVMGVLFYHAGYSWALGGFLGVETFFVLSGFLITSLLLTEWQATGGIDLKHFWLRRARRLLPAVWLLMLVLPVVAFVLAPDAWPRLREDIPAALFYITNWVYVVREVPYFEAFGRPPLLQQLWSLAVEEQFYLLWPLLLVFLLRVFRNHRSGLVAATIVLIALSSIWMAILYSPEADPLRVYYGTDTRAAGFLLGALLAMVWSPQPGAGRRSRRAADVLGWAGLIAVMLLYNKLNEFQPFLYRGGILLTAFTSALLVVGAASPGTTLGRLLETPVLRWIGSRSYSIYLWHWPVFMLTRPGSDLDMPVLPVRVGQVVLTFALAELSYRWVETPVRQHGFRAAFLALQSGFRGWSVPQRAGLAAGILAASLLLLWQGSVDRVTADTAMQEIPTALNTARPNVVYAPATRTAVATAVKGFASPTAGRATRTATPALTLPGVTLIGDSIMQGAAPMMDDVLGKDIYVDAARKRKMEDVPALVDTLSKEGHLARVVVIHLGSNRPFEAPVFDEVMKTLLAHGVERVIFINVHRPIGWEEYINRKFAQGVERWPAAELIDWDALAHHEQGWFIKDQTHLSYAGSEAYVEAIKRQLDTIP